MNDWHSWAAIAVFVGAYALIIGEKIDVSAFHSEDSGIDWNVIFLLLCRVMFRRTFVYDEDRAAEVMTPGGAGRPSRTRACWSRA
ncbi:hypothetical protein OG824_38940 [Streptomyces prunicolor]|uniref:hypothetical protein n=1 Tax=Streptomyces prunicolor TaxID=67348 RepID=UPI00224F9AC7|nr:hypothetical protein [Streptomyces prunicolor]MCX5241201.1 hypothetical protein [Streptomyces prunicolor]